MSFIQVSGPIGKWHSEYDNIHYLHKLCFGFDILSRDYKYPSQILYEIFGLQYI